MDPYPPEIERLDAAYAILGFTPDDPEVHLIKTFENLNIAVAEIELMRRDEMMSGKSEDKKCIYTLMEQINYKITKTERTQ